VRLVGLGVTLGNRQGAKITRLPANADNLPTGETMRQLEGKTAFVTGGASGIGFGIAQALLDAGMNVAIADIMSGRLEQARDQLRSPDRLHTMILDVSDRAAVGRAADEVESRFGKVHVVCNNAGVGRAPDVMDVTYNDWDWVLGVNVMGVVNGVMSFLPKLRAHGEGGHIVNTSSMAGLIPVPGMGGVLYCTSKFAVRGLSDSLRLTLAAEGIGVSVLCPALVRSNIMKSEVTRPAGLVNDSQAAAVDDEIASASNAGMDPLEVGEAVRDAILGNKAYILTHSEHRDEVAGLFADIVAAFPPDQQIDPGRFEAEEARRGQTRAAMAAVDRLTRERLGQFG
jgi:NAD(P)-dependent dehydrogenase (short-subunit alcohol dehydrogenase family)